MYLSYNSCTLLACGIPSRMCDSLPVVIKAYSKALSGVCLVINAQRVTGALEILFTSDGVHRGRDVGG